MKTGDRLFVYGTLRPNASNYRLLDGRANHLGTVRIPARLYNLGWFPGIKLSSLGDPNPEEVVEGDVFEIVDPALPEDLDNYEGYPNLYDRQLVPTDDGGSAWAYVYNGRVSEDSRITTGVWDID